MKRSSIVQRRTNLGQAIIVADMQITPQSEVVQLPRPFITFSWQRPTALLIERAGQKRRLRLWDVNRLVQAGLLSLAVLFTVVGIVFGDKKRKKSDESASQ